MKPTIIIGTFIFLLLLSASCTERSDEGVEEQPGNAEVKSALVESNNRFALQLFAKIIESENADTNTFISPLSVYYALAMAYNGAEGGTKDAFKETLQWHNLSDDAILQSLKDLHTELVETPSDVTLEIANSMWPREDFPIKQPFIDVNKNYLNAKVQSLDFNDPASVDIINNWIEENTNDMIQDMLKSIPPDAVLYLINAIYFNGLWKYQFADSSNYEDDFTLADNTTKEVTYMKQKESFAFAQNDIFSAVQMPYNDTNYYMLAMLPNRDGTTHDIIDQMNMENWKAWQEAFSMKEVTLSLPKFSYSYGSKLLNSILSDLGLGVAFDPKSANFVNISDEPTFISRVMHKARVEVDEKGTEAAAVTIVEFVVTSEDPNKRTFTANRPFLFAICEKQTNAILFMGKVTEPVID